jgi:transglutaminase-like putative cysteine protease
MHPEIVEQAKILIKEPTPAEAMKKFSEWLVTRVVGDASVVNTCVDDTMRNGAGHCGHRAAVLRQFAKALGIESRYIGGCSLNFEDGGTEEPLFQLNPTWSNNHAWMELDIPSLGWVEVEPAGKDKIFTVPANYVQTRGNFQNYDVRIMQNGKWVRPTWETVTENGSNRFVSDIGLRNVITYEILRGPEQDAEQRDDGISDSSHTPQESAL